MSEQTVTAVFVNPKVMPGQARTAAQRFLADCEKLFEAGIERVAAQAMPEEDARTIQQLRFLWGVVYKETSEQGRIDGQQYSPDAWHELGKRLHLPRRITKTRVAGRKRPVITTTIGSTQGLSVRKMAVYIDKFMAWASTDYGVVFSEPLSPELRPQRKRQQAMERGDVDADTGEVMVVA